MPKSIELRLQIGGAAPPPPPGRDVPQRGITGTVNDIEWPATVVRAEGQWLWIEDESGYNSTPRAGWVNTEEVVRLGDSSLLHDAITYYGDELKLCHAPWLHWLRGICLESKKDVHAALNEYALALSESRTPAVPIEGFPPADLVEGQIRATAPSPWRLESYQADAMTRRERINVEETKSSAVAFCSAQRIYQLILCGERRPRLYYETAQR